MPTSQDGLTLLEPWTTTHPSSLKLTSHLVGSYLCSSYCHPLLHPLVRLHCLSSLNIFIPFRLVWNFLPICLFNFIWITLLHHWRTSPNTTYLKYRSSHRCSYRLYAPVAPYHKANTQEISYLKIILCNVFVIHKIHEGRAFNIAHDYICSLAKLFFLRLRFIRIRCI